MMVSGEASWSFWYNVRLEGFFMYLPNVFKVAFLLFRCGRSSISAMKSWRGTVMSTRRRWTSLSTSPSRKRNSWNEKLNWTRRIRSVYRSDLFEMQQQHKRARSRMAREMCEKHQHLRHINSGTFIEMSIPGTKVALLNFLHDICITHWTNWNRRFARPWECSQSGGWNPKIFLHENTSQFPEENIYFVLSSRLATFPWCARGL